MSDSPGRGAWQADFRFEVGSLTVDDLKVVGFSGSEGLDFATIIGKTCELWAIARRK